VNFDTSRAFLWERGSIVDLNALVPPKSPLYLLYAYTINNRGEIAVNGIDAHDVEQAAVLIPCDENHADVEGCDYDTVDDADASNSRPMPAGLAAATSTQPLTSSEIVTPWRTRMQRGFHIPGAATLAGVSFPQTVAVTDSQSTAVQKITITSPTPPAGTVGLPYATAGCLPGPWCQCPCFILRASGGVPPYSWTWTPQPGSSLPPGLSIGPVGFFHRIGIYGRPRTAGNYNVTVKVTDSASPPAHASANYTIDID
jgi:hypothetical protein